MFEDIFEKIKEKGKFFVDIRLLSDETILILYNELKKRVDAGVGLKDTLRIFEEEKNRRGI